MSRPAPPTAVPTWQGIKEHGPLEEIGIWRRASGDTCLNTTCVTECRDESDWSVVVEAYGAREVEIRAHCRPEPPRRPQRCQRQRQSAPWWSWTPCLLPLPEAASRGACAASIGEVLGVSRCDLHKATSSQRSNRIPEVAAGSVAGVHPHQRHPRGAVDRISAIARAQTIGPFT